MEKDYLFKKQCWNNWTFAFEKLNLDTDLTSFIKFNATWLTVNCKTIKDINMYIKITQEINLHDHGLAMSFRYSTKKQVP